MQWDLSETSEEYFGFHSEMVCLILYASEKDAIRMAAVLKNY